MTDDVTTASELEAHIATLDPATITINPEPVLSPEPDVAAPLEASDAPAPVADAASGAVADGTLIGEVEKTKVNPAGLLSGDRSQEINPSADGTAATYAEAVHEVTHRSFGRASADEPMPVTTHIGGV